MEINILRHDQLLTKSSDDPDWVVNNIVRAGSVGFIAGAPKSFKSYLALHIAQAVATGTPVLGHFPVPSPRRVLFLEEEDPCELVTSRYRALELGHHIPTPAPGFLNFSVQTGYKVNFDADGSKLVAAVQGTAADLLIVDVLNKVHNFDDSSQKGATSIMGVFERVRRETGAAVLLVHHFSKGSPNRRGNQRMRGSSVFAGWSENSLYVTRRPDQRNPGGEGFLDPMVDVEVESKFAQVPNFSYQVCDMSTAGGLRLDYVHMPVQAEDVPLQVTGRGLAFIKRMRRRTGRWGGR